MRQDWGYRVTVTASGMGLAYEGKFVRYCYAEKVARRKLAEYGSGAIANIYSRWDGTQITLVADSYVETRNLAAFEV